MIPQPTPFAIAPELISDYLEQHASVSPERIALLFEDRTTSYAELNEQVRSFARALLSAGIGKGDRVATLSTPRPEFLVSYLASVSIGAVWMGLNPRYSVRELAYLLSDASPQLVFGIPATASDNYPQTLREAMGQAGLHDTRLIALGPEDVAFDQGLAAFLRAGAQTDPADLRAARAGINPADPAIVVYTSGTTGESKGALLRHSGIVRLGRVQSRQWAIDQPRIICNQPINHIGCVGDLCSVALIAGGSIVFKEKFDASDTLATIERHRVNGLFQIPTQLQRAAAAPEFDDVDLSSLQLVAWGGAPLPLEVLHKFRARGCRVSTTYGLTEVTSSVTYSDSDASDEVLSRTVGRPDPELQVRLLRADLTWAEPAEAGEVCVKHPTVMAGYLNRPQQTADAFTPDGWLRTGDLGEFLADGNLRLIGRLSEMYKSGGYNIYPREIELVLESFAGVALAAVVSRPDTDYFEVGVAYVQATSGTLDLAALQRWAKARLANYKVPKEFHAVTLPLLPNGKIDKQQLRRRATPSAS